MREQHEDVAARLRLLDHPLPAAIGVDDVIARARTRPRRRGPALVAAGLLVAATAAAALPVSPLHRALVHAFTSAPAAATTGAVAPAAAPAAGAGVSLMPGHRITIRFVAPPRDATLRVVVAPVAELSLVPEGGDAAFAVGTEAIVVNHASATTFALTVPEALGSLRVERDGALLLEKRDTTVATRAPRDSAGRWIVALGVPR